jgi:hypothetical protein
MPCVMAVGPRCYYTWMAMVSAAVRSEPGKVSTFGSGGVKRKGLASWEGSPWSHRQRLYHSACSKTQSAAVASLIASLRATARRWMGHVASLAGRPAQFRNAARAAGTSALSMQ